VTSHTIVQKYACDIHMQCWAWKVPVADASVVLILVFCQLVQNITEKWRQRIGLLDIMSYLHMHITEYV